MAKLQKFATWMDGFKQSKRALIVLIILDIFMAIGSNIVDWPILAQVDWYLIPFAPICSLYPLTLAIWFTIYYFKKRVPTAFTAFIFMGITAYGIMAQIYYPVFIYFEGLHFNLVGNMIWVAIYAIQSFIIASELRPLKIYQYIPLIGYFVFKDYSDRYLGTFTDILYFDFSEFAISALFALMIIMHIGSISTTIYISFKNTAKQKAKLELQPQEIPV